MRSDCYCYEVGRAHTSGVRVVDRTISAWHPEETTCSMQASGEAASRIYDHTGSLEIPAYLMDPIFFFNFIYLFIYFWLCWVFVSVRGLSLVVASGGHSSSRCAGLSLSRPLSLRSTGSRRAGSVVVAHGPSCSAACGISPDQGSNPCRLH